MRIIPPDAYWAAVEQHQRMQRRLLEHEFISVTEMKSLIVLIQSGLCGAPRYTFYRAHLLEIKGLWSGLIDIAFRDKRRGVLWNIRDPAPSSFPPRTRT
jgi:hypothetical protein